MSPEIQTMPDAAYEIAWLKALHALEMCQQVAELAARCGESRQYREASGSSPQPAQLARQHLSWF